MYFFFFDEPVIDSRERIFRGFLLVVYSSFLELISEQPSAKEIKTKGPFGLYKGTRKGNVRENKIRKSCCMFGSVITKNIESPLRHIQLHNVCHSFIIIKNLV
jgi:hypothetical protein